MTVVVGIDGSEESRRALEWAADEARLRDEELLVVHAYHIPAPYLTAVYPTAVRPEELAHEVRRAADTLLHESVDRAETALKGVRVRAEAVGTGSSAAHALRERARDASLLVVGSRGRGGFRGLLLGSVSQQCVQHATCPVAVIPPRR